MSLSNLVNHFYYVLLVFNGLFIKLNNRNEEIWKLVTQTNKLNKYLIFGQNTVCENKFGQ